VSKEIIPEAEAAARFPSALSGIVLIGVVILFVFEVTRNPYAAAAGGGILATTSSFIEPARQARFDILVSLFVILSVYAFMRAMKDRRWFLWFGAFVGLGVLSKGPIEVFGIIGALGVACAYRRINWLRDPYFWGGVGISLLVALPWHIYETVEFGSRFWATYLNGQILDRVAAPLFTVAITNVTYLQYIFEFAAPWALAFCGALVAGPFVWKKLVTKERALLVASVIGVFAVLAVCFITQTKAISYLIPLYPFMALTIIVAVVGLYRFRSRTLRIFLTLLLAILFIAGYKLTLYNGFHTNGYYWYEVSLADEEKTIAETLIAKHAPQFYVYDTTTLGSIMYYSHLVKPEFAAASIPQGAYVLYQTSELKKLETAYPQMHFTPLYQGASLSLTVAD
jgi:4-amino-4-deoxy-L-arabinose transferase-like glycosyltransferase